VAASAVGRIARWPHHPVAASPGDRIDRGRLGLAVSAVAASTVAASAVAASAVAASAVAASAVAASSVSASAVAVSAVAEAAAAVTASAVVASATAKAAVTPLLADPPATSSCPDLGCCQVKINVNSRFAWKIIIVSTHYIK
jgi:hypothetical protein